MATRRRPQATHARRMGPEGAGGRASSRSKSGRSSSSTRRRRRGASRPRLARSAAVLTLVAAAIVLVGAPLGAWDAILEPIQVADREPAPTGPPASGAPGGAAFGPVVWSSGQDLEQRGEEVRREGRPIPPAELTGYVWPLPGAVLTNPYGPSGAGTFRVDGQRFHDGLDLSTKCGDPIVAAHGGTVLAAGRRYDEAIGWLGDLAAYIERLEDEDLWGEIAIAVVIDDGNGYRSIYAHFKSVIVTVGQRVEAGDPLGLEGKTGDATGCHLHYAIFSPRETASIRLVRRIAERSLLPGRAIARIDPLLVLPTLEEGGITLPE